MLSRLRRSAPQLDSRVEIDKAQPDREYALPVALRPSSTAQADKNQMDLGFLRRVPNFVMKPRARAVFRSPLTWLAVAMVLYGILVAEKVSPYVGGSDSSGYYNSARLLSAG